MAGLCIDVMQSEVIKESNIIIIDSFMPISNQHGGLKVAFSLSV